VRPWPSRPYLHLNRDYAAIYRRLGKIDPWNLFPSTAGEEANLAAWQQVPCRSIKGIFIMYTEFTTGFSRPGVGAGFIRKKRAPERFFNSSFRIIPWEEVTIEPISKKRCMT
jgi:hypothetical protein